MEPIAGRDVADAQPLFVVPLDRGDAHAVGADGDGLDCPAGCGNGVAAFSALEDGGRSVAVEVLGEEPVVLGDGLLRAPAAAVGVAAGDRDAGLSRGLVVLEFGDRSCRSRKDSPVNGSSSTVFGPMSDS